MERYGTLLDCLTFLSECAGPKSSLYRGDSESVLKVFQNGLKVANERVKQFYAESSGEYRKVALCWESEELSLSPLELQRLLAVVSGVGSICGNVELANNLFFSDCDELSVHVRVALIFGYLESARVSCLKLQKLVHRPGFPTIFQALAGHFKFQVW